jgi:hypothetical protein
MKCAFALRFVVRSVVLASVLVILFGCQRLQYLRTASTGEEPLPIWNVWAEQAQAHVGFMPLPRLLVNHQYQLVVELAAFDYESEGIYANRVSEELREALDNSTDDEVLLDVLAVPDDRYFQQGDDAGRSKQLVVNVRAIRRSAAVRPRRPESPLTYLREHPDAPFSFGRITFTITTKGRPGLASVGLTFWSSTDRAGNAVKVPLDELTVSLCLVVSLEAHCEADSTETALTLRGPESLKLALQREHSALLPDAALHIVELDGSTAIGTFRCNTCETWGPNQFATWRLGDSGAELSEYLGQTILTAFESAAAAADTSAFRRAGQALYRKIFSTGDVPRPPAEEQFREFVLQPATSQPRSIFVRLLSRDRKPLFMVPLGLMAVPVAGKTRFVGLDFIVESPLRIQEYSARGSCISRWVLLVPPEDSNQPEMESARGPFSVWLAQFGQGSSPTIAVYDDIAKFGNWLDPSDQMRTDSSTAIVIVSHHDRNRLFFNRDTETPFILSANITRRFSRPSIAIVNACGTAGPGAHDLVLQLNRMGITSVIATATEVNSEMSGHFLALLLSMLRDHASDTAYTIGRAKFDAVRALSQTPIARPYGPQALIYMLLGDGSVRLCSPVRATP